ncbi:hypothetical protein N0V90_000469 [Kalmusia sp. IMI 367209]|nr:hypothetical protein N0V90_000469 [Kalmusia sp. IMI 367209]
MRRFEYEPLNLEGYTFRLLRLFRGGYGPLRCELFNTWLCVDDDSLDNYKIEYEALSYTWGGTEKPCEIEVNEKNMLVTENLSYALRQLRHPDRDRILWIDAICIDQRNNKERTHQVGQMTSIYKEAERVLIWLGQSSSETDVTLHYMQQLEKEAFKHVCKDWTSSDERWQGLWWTTKELLGNVRCNAMLQMGIKTLLSRHWFKRVWIIQEVANARSATVICGTKSVSARIFAIVPPLIGITPDPHCQAILDIMPGPSRNHSWWSQDHDLRTLLCKFKASEATDPRDVIYALLGISSDRHRKDFLIPNYEKSVEELTHDTITSLLHLHGESNGIPILPQWVVADLLQNMDFLEEVLFFWAVRDGHEITAKLLLEHDKFDVDFENSTRQMPLSYAINHGSEAMVKLLLDTGKFDVNLGDSTGRTPLSYATSRGNTMIVRLLLDTGKVDVNLRDLTERTPLSYATTYGNEAIVKLLLDTGKVDVSFENLTKRTLLSHAVSHGVEALFNFMIDNNQNNFNFEDSTGRTPLSYAISHGSEEVVKLLLEFGQVHGSFEDSNGRTPLSYAISHRSETMVKFILDTSKVDVNLEDSTGRTPLSYAISHGSETMVKLILGTGKVDVNLEDSTGRTPLSYAISYGSEELVRLLLNTGKVDVNFEDLIERTPLPHAISRRSEGIVKLLLDTSKTNVNPQGAGGAREG